MYGYLISAISDDGCWNRHVVCECGAKVTKHCLEKHKETAKHAKLMINPNHYGQAATDQRRKDNEQRRNEADKMKCYCGLAVPRNQIKQHLKSKEHQEMKAKLSEP